MFLIWLGLLPQMQAFERRLSKVVKKGAWQDFCHSPSFYFYKDTAVIVLQYIFRRAA